MISLSIPISLPFCSTGNGTVPTSEENWVFPKGRKTSHPSRKTLTRAALEATLLSQSGEHELELTIAGTRVALASFNDHHWHVSTEFGFDADGTVVSGCAEFGLKRWLAAMRQAGTLQ